MKKNPALESALAHFSAHAAATATLEGLHRRADAVSERLTESANASKPDFAAISRLHSERQHVADRIQRTAEEIKKLEANYEKPGFEIYHEVNRSRDRAADAAVECVHARLMEDFPDQATRDFVARRHPVLVAEDTRKCYAASPNDARTFAAFAAALPDLLRQIEQADKRTAIYRAATASRSLPSQSALDAATPEQAKPVSIAPRRELTAAQEQERDEALISAENKRLRDLYHQGRAIAGDYNENADALLAFISKHPEVARFFPHRRANTAA